MRACFLAVLLAGCSALPRGFFAPAPALPQHAPQPSLVLRASLRPSQWPGIPKIRRGFFSALSKQTFSCSMLLSRTSDFMGCGFGKVGRFERVL